MKYRLRYREHDLELPPGRFVIGRSASCQLSLDDPLVSRQHAVMIVSDDGVSIEDLGSRNGVLVDDARIQGVRVLVAGERVVIGGQRLELIEVESGGAGAPSARRERRAAPTARFPAFGVLGGLADKALALGHVEEAERLLGSLMSDVLERAGKERGTNDESIERATSYAMRLATLGGKALWVDYVVRLHHALARPLPASVIDELHVLLRRVTDVDRALFRDYVTGLRDRASTLGPADRFLLNRLEGLERMISLR